jgi:AraC-like DNA-binding protein
LRFYLDFLPLGGVTVGIVRGTPSTFIRRPIDRNDALYMVVNRKGCFRVVQSQQRFDLAVGDAAVFDNRCSSEFHCLDEGETWSLSLPREALRHLVHGIDQTIERHVPASDPALRLLTAYLDALFAVENVAEPALAGVHVGDLVASVPRPKPAGGPSSDEPGPRRDRAQSILDAIARQAGDPELDPARLAEPLGLSVRYLHRVLEDTGRTFSQHLLHERLERAHRLLRDPRLAQSRISDVALSAGFTDLSHFNRCYRRHFNETPSTTRANAALKENR